MISEEAGGNGGGPSEDRVGVSNVKQLICSPTVSGCVCVLFVCMDV